MKAYNYFLFSLVLLITISNISLAQPLIEWDKTLGGSGSDKTTSIIQTSDGGYLLAGISYSGISGEKSEDHMGFGDYWIVKVDADGNKTWDKTLGGARNDMCWSLLQTTDGGYLLGGSSISNISGNRTADSRGGRDYWIVKLDMNGNKTWDKAIGGDGSDDLHCMIQTADGNYLLGGESTSNISGEKSENCIGGSSLYYDYWIVKVDIDGNKIWDKTIGGNGGESLRSIIQTTDGGYLLGGISTSNISGDKSENLMGGSDYWIVKVDANGNKTWDNTIGGNGIDPLGCIIQTADGGYLLGGRSDSDISGDKSENSSGNGDYWIVKVDVNGIKTWDKTIGGNYFDQFSNIIQTTDGGYLIGGHSNSDISGEKSENSHGSSDYWIVKVNVNGNKTWDKTVGGNSSDESAYLVSVIQTDDEGYLLGGSSNSDISGDKSENCRGGFWDYWIVKLGPINQPLEAICQNTTIQLDINGQATLMPFSIDNGSTGNNITFSVSPNSFDCNNIGDNTVTLTVTDYQGNTATCNANVTVEDNISPVVICQDISVKLDANGNASVAPEDIDNGSSDACGIASLSITPDVLNCENIGENTVTLTATDVNGNSASETAIVTVINNAPEITGLTGPTQPVELGSMISLVINFNDLYGTNLNVSWSDGQENDYGVLTGTVIPEHTYETPGVYSVIVTCTDACNETDVSFYNYVVIYDPDGGFVTGGGWIDSPEGAYMPDPLLTGKANFGFVAKYKKGKIVPDGNTEFQFKAGDLNFNSYAYDWLVIAGAKAKYKGEGTINGSGTYGFMLSAIDADLTPSSVIDKFRIKIWDKDDGDALVYDNQFGDADDADATTVIGGGSIVIHTKKEKLKGASVIEPEAKIIVYPNPFDNSINVELFSESTHEIIIDMVDMNGRVIEYLYTGILAAEVEHRFEFNTKADLTPGTYMLRIRTEQEELLGREIIIKR